ncbi:hypothetical protein PFICI_02720 [Pestalotiopsis fici W106-1]|uniref:Phosphatidylinositol-specific phospholipase C X domain-containing protein n=1 Tax=Pestalotiopsis fici (strain W106-1 / CGMCC3.15140) TaxID=1229662 RepID=W3XF76_PESFW|nr:uncharacterized protein PFICI_02720 [Pestalotiopsis fici W106-1]ETS84695.1 hypothetical protein PFICI_02720 [Pestalotiopsis fici W106-1]
MASNWMSSNLNVLGKQKIEHIMFPGSHDSGMSRHGKHTTFGTPSVTLTQTKTIKEQLRLGIRYFDVRLDISQGKYFCGHYTKIDGVPTSALIGMGVLGPPPVKALALALKAAFPRWEGACGESLQEIIQGINEFLKENKELVVLDISGYGGFAVDEQCRDFTQMEWTNLFKELQGIEKLYRPKDADRNKKLKDLQLDELISSSSGACVVINHWRGEKYVGGYDLKGIFPRSSWGENEPPMIKWSKELTDGAVFLALAKEAIGGSGYNIIMQFWNAWPGFMKTASLKSFFDPMAKADGEEWYKVSIIDGAKSRNKSLPQYLKDFAKTTAALRDSGTKFPTVFMTAPDDYRAIVIDAVEDTNLADGCLAINMERAKKKVARQDDEISTGADALTWDTPIESRPSSSQALEAFYKRIAC